MIIRSFLLISQRGEKKQKDQKLKDPLAAGDVIEGAVRGGMFKIIDVRGLDLIHQSYIFYLKENPLFVPAQQFLLLLRAARKQ